MPNRTRSLPACRLGLLCVPLLFVALHAGAADHPNPLVAQRADPHVFRHSDGWYYFTATVPEYDRIELRRGRALDQLGTAEPRVIWRKHPSGEMGSHIWAPEIHRIDGKWYVYFAAGGAERENNTSRKHGKACRTHCAARHPPGTPWRVRIGRTVRGAVRC